MAGCDDAKHVITRTHENKEMERLNLWEIGRWPCLRLSWSIGHDDAVEVEKEDEFDDANNLFVNF